jgi:hypothetical protein
MLSAVLKSDIAVEVRIKIMNSFVEMRSFLVANREMFARLDRVELKQLQTDERLEEVFNYISSNAEVKQSFGITKIEDNDLIRYLINKVQ